VKNIGDLNDQWDMEDDQDAHWIPTEIWWVNGNSWWAQTVSAV
jgi:hypothetical protein